MFPFRRRSRWSDNGSDGKSKRSNSNSNSSRPTSGVSTPPYELDDSPETRAVRDQASSLENSPQRNSPASSLRPPEGSSSVAIYRLKDPLGLTVLYEPESPPTLDIIFIHGLGGTSQATWTRDQDPHCFWPAEWLPSEPGICEARILSFGYNAIWAAIGSALVSGIADFAKDLLFSMKFAKNDDLEELELGQRPIIFIVHSMGGLVAKQAYIIGQHDHQFSDIVSSIRAIMFLATPHRGSDLAEILSRILTVSFFHRPKLYISELSAGSQTVAALNEQLRHLARRLEIISFYETLQTSYGPKKMMVVGKDSATLGYHMEISNPLNADHHTVCKFKSNLDSNYIYVRNALKTLVSSICEKGESLLSQGDTKRLERLRTFLAISDTYQHDLEFFHSKQTPGTCEWIRCNPLFSAWMDETIPTSDLLWIHALRQVGSLCCRHLLRTSYQENGFVHTISSDLATTLNAHLAVAYELLLFSLQNSYHPSARP
ncbi:Cytochrome cd1-nitrite reductase-like C-terminal heme d1 [Penicillium malachiteum]|nr:Cytochrome cd1-nitrite reductase-like C-terminal heme d1 [Penicillium malachiteum]